MKILRILALVLCFSAGYVLPSVAAPADTPAAHEMHKGIKGPRHHHGMSKAMMNELNLSDKQKAQWEKLSAQKKAETEALREQMKKLREQEMKINKKYEGEIMKILTPAQAEKYKSMLPQRPEKPERREPKR